MAAKFDLKQLETHLKKYSLQVSGAKRRKRNRDTPFAYLAITEKHSVPAECVLQLILYSFRARDPLSPSFLVWKGTDKHYFWFDDGVVVAWGVDSTDLKSLDSITEACAAEVLTSRQTERMYYKVGEKPAVDKELDTLVVTTENQFREMSLFSVGLAR